MTTCWPESRWWISRVASMPSRTGHADVHQNDVGGELRDEAYGLVAVLGAPDDDEPAVGVEDLLHECRELLVVLADDDAQWWLGHRGGACHSRP